MSAESHQHPKPEKSLCSAEDLFRNGLEFNAKGEYKQAIKSYTSALKLNPNFYDIYLERASTYIQLKQFEKARKDLEKIPLFFLKNSYFYQIYGSLYYCLEEYEIALTKFDMAIQYDADNPMLYWSRGITHSILCNFTHAVADLDKAFKTFLQIDPHDTTNSISNLRNELARAYFDLGMSQWCEGKKEQVLQNLNLSIRLNPFEFETYCFRGILFLSNGNIKAAIKNYLKAIKINSKASEAYLLIGLTLRYKLGKTETSIKYFDKAIYADNKFVEAYLLRCLAHLSIGNVKEGIQDLKIISNICSVPSNIEMEILSGRISSEIRAFLHRIYPSFGLVWNPALILIRFVIRLCDGNLNEIEEDFFTLKNLFNCPRNIDLIFDPQTGLECTSAYIGLGMFYFSSNENTKALDYFTKVICTNPEMYCIYLLRGITLYELGDAQKAIWDIQQAIKLLSNNNKTELMQIAVNTLISFEKPCNSFSIREEFDNIYHIIQTMEDRFQNIFLSFEESQARKFDKLSSTVERSRLNLVEVAAEIKQIKDEVLVHSQKIIKIIDNNLVIRDLQNELEDLAQKVNIVQDNSDLLSFLEQSLSEHLSEHLQRLIPKNYLLIGRSRMGVILNEAVFKAKEKLIMVCPWLNRRVIDSNMVLKLRQLAEKGVSVLIGWGYPEKEVPQWKLKNTGMSIDEFVSFIPSNERWKYNAVEDLKELQIDLPGKIILSNPIGTHEKYLVCDNEFALITSHNFLLSDDRSKTMEIGIRTSDAKIISDLIKHSEKYFSK